jgi:uncharacterized membrane protein required for colicin V production
MNWIDILLILVVLFSAWAGLQKGFLHACADLFTWIGAMVLAFVCYPVIADKAEKTFGPSLWIMPVTFLVCLFLMGAKWEVTYRRDLSENYILINRLIYLLL